LVAIILLTKEKERFLISAPKFSLSLQLTLLLSLLVTPSEPFHSTGGIDNSLLTGVIWMALTAQLHADFLFRRTDGKGISAGTDYFCFGEILRVYFFFHINYSA
jgi:hypothetical protein